MKGFTLLEVMVALAIMAGVILTVISSVNYHLSLTTRNNEETIALLLARENLKSWNSSINSNWRRGRRVLLHRSGRIIPGRLRFPRLPVLIFKTLTVTVTWGTQRRTLSLEHYLLQEMNRGSPSSNCLLLWYCWFFSAVRSTEPIFP